MIAVVSDSHVPNRAPEIPPRVLETIEEADKVVHAGDFASEETFNELDSMFELVAVRGNCDFFELPISETFEVGNTRIGVYHGSGINPRGDHDTLVDIAKNKLEVDILIHGHTHRQEAVKVDGVLLLNPGSCTGVGGGSSRRGSPKMMKLEVEEEIVVELLSFGDEKSRDTKRFTL